MQHKKYKAENVKMGERECKCTKKHHHWVSEVGLMIHDSFPYNGMKEAGA